LGKRSLSPWGRIRTRDPAVLYRELAVLDHLERNLVMHLLDCEPGRVLVLDDEAFDLVVGDVARPDDREVAPRRVADPAFLAVEDPGVALTLRRSQETGAGTRADQRLGQPEAADLLHASHGRQPLLRLLLRAVEVNGIHREAAVDAVKGAERRIGSRDVHGDQPDQQRAPARAAVAVHAGTGEAQLLERREELERKSVLDPVLVDDRRDL